MFLIEANELKQRGSGPFGHPSALEGLILDKSARRKRGTTKIKIIDRLQNPPVAVVIGIKR